MIFLHKTNLRWRKFSAKLFLSFFFATSLFSVALSEEKIEPALKKCSIEMWLPIISKIIDGIFSMAWPIVTVVIIYIFGEQLRKILLSLSEMIKRFNKATVGNVTFEQSMNEEIEEVVNEMPATEQKELIETQNLDMTKIKIAALKRIENETMILGEFSKFKSVNVAIERNLRIGDKVFRPDGVFIDKKILYIIEHVSSSQQISKARGFLRDIVNIFKSNLSTLLQQNFASNEGVAYDVKGILIIPKDATVNLTNQLLLLLDDIEIYEFDPANSSFARKTPREIKTEK